MRERKYDDAILALRAYITSCSTHVSIGDAQYWIGEGLFSQSKFSEAVPQFETFLSAYPKSDFTSRAIYKIGRCFQEMDKKSEAKKRFQEVIDKFPATLEAKQSKERLKELK
ncbi:MAG: tol-pal system protein YbgF [bacterium]|nr:tol-pal system protein YbgF [bacterium]